FLSSLRDSVASTTVEIWATEKPDFATSQVPVSEISIRNYKALRHLNFRVPEGAGDRDTASCMVILGENATGKSSVLEALALGLLGLKPIEVLRRRAREAKLRPDLSPNSPPVLRRVLGLMFGPKRPVFLVPDCWRIRWALDYPARNAV